MYSPKRRFRLFRALGPPAPPSGSGASILGFARSLATTYLGFNSVPTDGGALTINSQSVGGYELTTRSGDTTISSFNASDWFTSTKDTTSSWIVVNGNLTINAGQTIIPAVRKLFTVVYVTGNLICNGSISMTARGANHSGTGDSGGATTAVDIRIGTGTFSAITNPQIPATGGNGAPRKVATLGTSGDDGFNSGTAGSSGGTGGGGGGYLYISPINSYAGKGGNGTCFSGGTGSGSCYVGQRSVVPPNNSEDAGESGGAGTPGVGSVPVGGSGNPRGDSFGGTGTGGVLIVICEGALSGTGSIVANGVDTTSRSGVTGGASGGGSVTVLFGTNVSGPSTLAANGGTTRGGANGTARKLAIGAN